jgi:methionyl aminopeptidase
MVRLKTKKDVLILREGGKRLASILAAVAREVKPGVSTAYLDQVAARLIKEAGDQSAFLNYKPRGARRPFPASLCVSINDEVVHGIPTENPRILEEGDIVSLDLGLKHKDLITDHAVTVAVGKIDPELKKLLEITEQALLAGIKAAKPGNKTGDIGAAIEEFVRPYGYGIVEELAGHGVGYAVHEDPFVPNFGVPNQGVLLQPGLVIAIEPMLTTGGPDIEVDQDGYTILTSDKSMAAHFEHTIVITEKGADILTRA